MTVPYDDMVLSNGGFGTVIFEQVVRFIIKIIKAKYEFRNLLVAG